MNNLVFLKLGGSLITEKNTPSTPRMETITRLASEIHAATLENPDLQLILGHGSGSFGHTAARKYGTRRGVDTPEGWRGFAEVWLQAGKLNHLLIDALHKAGLPAVSFPLSAGATAADGEVISWNLEPLRVFLAQGLLPVVYGDVVVDTVLGGTILSTEDIFIHLAAHLKPTRILLAGLEPGVWADYPQCSRLLERINSENIDAYMPGLSGSTAVDVTGGMRGKVELMLDLVKTTPGLEIFIFSGEKENTVQAALSGTPQGTKIVQ